MHTRVTYDDPGGLVTGGSDMANRCIAHVWLAVTTYCW